MCAENVSADTGSATPRSPELRPTAFWQSLHRAEVRKDSKASSGLSMEADSVQGRPTRPDPRKHRN